MSDLSQLYVNQTNSVSLYPQNVIASGNVQSGTVSMPNRLQNYNEYGLTGATASPSPVLQGAIINYNSQTPNKTFAQEYLFAGAYFHIEYENASEDMQSGNNILTFPNGKIVGANYGTFNQNNGYITIALSGVYFCTYSISSTPTALPNGSVLSSSIGIIPVSGAPAFSTGQAVLSPSPNSTGDIVGGSAIVKLNKGDVITVQYFTSTFTAPAALVLNNACLTFYMISPY